MAAVDETKVKDAIDALALAIVTRLPEPAANPLHQRFYALFIALGAEEGRLFDRIRRLPYDFRT
jgi:hypothetical protein